MLKTPINSDQFKWIPRSKAFALMRESLPSFFSPADENETAKILNNWSKAGLDVPIQMYGRRYGFSQETLSNWTDKLKKSFVQLSADDYEKCLIFGMKAYYRGFTHANFNRQTQRGVGEFLTNQIQGKLGEIALQRLLENNYRIRIELDFTVTGAVTSQDVLSVSTRKGVVNQPGIKVSVKATKLKNVLLAVPSGEATLTDRRSDVYVLSNVGLPDDHLLRYLKTKKACPEVFGLCSNKFHEIPCRIGGWISYRDLTKNGPLSAADIKKNFDVPMASPNYVCPIGQLSTDFVKLATLINGTATQCV